MIVRSFRPGSFERFGLDARALASLRPGIVVVDLCAYGWTGPWAQRRGFDSLVQLASGIAAECGAHTGVPEPRALPAQVLDHATGWLAAGAVMTALRRRAVEGGSWRVRLALARTGLWLDSLGRAAASAELSEVDDLLEVVASPFGAVTHVRMPGALPASPAHWAHGPRVPGSDPADWW